MRRQEHRRSYSESGNRRRDVVVSVVTAVPAEFVQEQFFGHTLQTLRSHSRREPYKAVFQHYYAATGRTPEQAIGRVLLVAMRQQQRFERVGLADYQKAQAAALADDPCAFDIEIEQFPRHIERAA